MRAPRRSRNPGWFYLFFGGWKFEAWWNEPFLFSWSLSVTVVQPAWTSQSFTTNVSRLWYFDQVRKLKWNAPSVSVPMKTLKWPVTLRKGVKNDQLSFSSFEDRLRLPNVDHFWNPQGMPFGLCPTTAQGVPIPYYCSVNNWRVTIWVCQSGLDMTKLESAEFPYYQSIFKPTHFHLFPLFLFNLHSFLSEVTAHLLPVYSSALAKRLAHTSSGKSPKLPELAERTVEKGWRRWLWEEPVTMK